MVTKLLFCWLIVQTTCQLNGNFITQNDLEGDESSFVNIIGFESWLPCNHTDLHKNIDPTGLRCRSDTNTYHKLTLDVKWGSSVIRQGQDFQYLAQHENHVIASTIPLKIAADATGVSALESPLECINLGDGDCLLLNQGEATLELRFSPLLLKKRLSFLPINEFPYDYNIGLEIISNTSKIIEHLEDRKEGVDFTCPSKTSSFEDKQMMFVNGERCEPIVCICGDDPNTTDVVEEDLLLFDVYGTGPSCGLFPIENAVGLSDFNGRVRFAHDNADGSQSYFYDVQFSSTNSRSTFNTLANERVVQVVIDDIRDAKRHTKSSTMTPGNLVICNWDGKTLWEGPNITNSVFKNTFKIPYVGGGTTKWTTAAWYYVDEDVGMYEYSPGGLPHNGITMSILRDHIERFSNRSFFVFNEEDSVCCDLHAYYNSDTFKTLLHDILIPNTTPRLVLEWDSTEGYDLLNEATKSRIVAPARTRVRQRTPGYYVRQENGASPISNELLKSTLDREEVEHSYFLDHELYGNDFLLQAGSNGYDYTKQRELTTLDFPFNYVLKSLALSFSNLPFETSLFSKNIQLYGLNNHKPLTTRINVLISDRVLTGRHLGNETRIPSTFARVSDPLVPEALTGEKDTFEYQNSRLYCHATSLANALEVGGELCNTGSSVYLRPENTRGRIICEVSPGIKLQVLDQGTPTGFVHDFITVISEDLKPRECTNFTYVVTPQGLAVPEPIDQVSSFYDTNFAELLGEGKCTLEFDYVIPYHPAVTRFNPTKVNQSITIGRYTAFCENVDEIGFPPSNTNNDEILSNLMKYKSPIPPQCDGAYDFKCMLSRVNQPDEDVGGAMMIILLFGIITGTALILGLGILAKHVYDRHVENEVTKRMLKVNKINKR